MKSFETVYLFLDMYSLLQLCTKYIQEGEEEIPLPAATPDGDTTLNELQVICRVPAEIVTWREGEAEHRQIDWLQQLINQVILQGCIML